MGAPVLLVACTIVQMHLGAGPPPSERTGQHTTTIVLTNVSRRPCTVDGYPSIALLDVDRRVLPFRYTHRGDQMITRTSPRPVRVPAGGHVYFAFNKYRCDTRALDVARNLRVGLPGVHTTSTLRLSRYPILDWCSPAKPSGVIAVSPLVASLSSAIR